MTEFAKFPKIPRLNRPFAITEKIDGTNAQVCIENGIIRAGSRNRWIEPGKTTDNAGFAAWVNENDEELIRLGEGTHYGEWYGQGIQRGYGMTEKRFALFNCDRWSDEKGTRPSCCDVVPVLARAANLNELADKVPMALDKLRFCGSILVPHFRPAEGIVIFSYSARQLWKVTLDNDSMSKGEAENLGLAA